jgi:glycine hydroxymethyltransferase
MYCGSHPILTVIAHDVRIRLETGRSLMDEMDHLFGLLTKHEIKLKRSFSFIPSENMISPLARLAYLSDGYSRYFFDEKEVFGRWNFQGGSIIGDIQRNILMPLFRKLAKAKYIDVRAVSGLTGMTLALAAFGGQPGSHMFSVPVQAGGHPDTQYVAQKLGLVAHNLPFASWDTLDLDQLGQMIEQEKPSLIYIDHATSLFPLNLETIIQVIRSTSIRPVHIHVDTSHINGLVWGGALPNPLECGADSFGGSTHKTFPGPHKAILFTNNAEVSERLTSVAVNMISHHHMSDVIALTITLIEFLECGGTEYASRILENAQAFAYELDQRGINVQGKKRGFTQTHQVWIDTSPFLSAHESASRLFDSGLIVNPFDPLPSLNGPGIRMGLNEPTRLGLREEHMKLFADYFREIIIEGKDTIEVAKKVATLRQESHPTYCYGPQYFAVSLNQLCSSFSSNISNEQALAEFLYI